MEESTGIRFIDKRNAKFTCHVAVFSQIMAAFKRWRSKYKRYQLQIPPQMRYRIVLHYGLFKITWDWLILLMVLYTAIEVPFVSSFILSRVDDINKFGKSVSCHVFLRVEDVDEELLAECMTNPLENSLRGSGNVIVQLSSSGASFLNLKQREFRGRLLTCRTGENIPINRFCILNSFFPKLSWILLIICEKIQLVEM